MLSSTHAHKYKRGTEEMDHWLLKAPRYLASYNTSFQEWGCKKPPFKPFQSSCFSVSLRPTPSPSASSATFGLVLK